MAAPPKRRRSYSCLSSLSKISLPVDLAGVDLHALLSRAVEPCLAQRREGSQSSRRQIGGDLQAARDAQTGADKEAERYDAAIAEAKGKGAITIRASKERTRRRARAETRRARRSARRKDGGNRKKSANFDCTSLQRYGGDDRRRGKGYRQSACGRRGQRDEVRAALRQSSKE